MGEQHANGWRVSRHRLVADVTVGVIANPMPGRDIRRLGASRQIGLTGAWRGPDRVDTDEVSRYDVSVSSWLDIPNWLGVALWVRERFRQEAVYIEIAGIPEILAR
jgi:hypothetical protein